MNLSKKIAIAKSLDVLLNDKDAKAYNKLVDKMSEPKPSKVEDKE